MRLARATLVAVIAIPLMLAACVANSSGLRVATDGFLGLCTWGNDAIEARLIGDMVENTSQSPLALVGARLGRHQHVELITWGFLEFQQDMLAAAPYDGTMLGETRMVLQPGGHAYVEVALRGLRDDAVGKVDGVIVIAELADGSLVELQTCATLGAMPKSLGVCEPGYEESDDMFVDVPYLETVCEPAVTS